MSDEVACGIQYRRPGPPQPGDRIVRCQLDAGHEGDHEELDTGSKWPSGIADLVGLDPNFTDGLSTNEYMRALRCGHYDECKAAEVERDRLAAELAQAKSDRERTVAVHTQAYNELSRAGAQRDESETQRAVQVAELGAANASLIRQVAETDSRIDQLMAWCASYLGFSVIHHRIRQILGIPDDAYPWQTDWVDDAPDAEVRRRFDALPKLEVVTTPPATWTPRPRTGSPAGKGETDPGHHCEQCGQPIEWRDDIDWWVHMDAANDIHMPPNPRDQLRDEADSRAGQADGEDRHA